MSTIKIELRTEDAAKIKEICASFNNDPQELINVLHKCQEHFGYLPAEVQEVVSNELVMPVAKIYGVVTFYSFFSTIPRGKHVVRGERVDPERLRGGAELGRGDGRQVDHGVNTRKRLIRLAWIGEVRHPALPMRTAVMACVHVADVVPVLAQVAHHPSAGLAAAPSHHDAHADPPASIAPIVRPTRWG